MVKTVIVALACLCSVPATLVAQPLTPVRDILKDQARIWQFPWGVAHGRHWKPVLTVTAVTAAAVVLDSPDTPYFRRTQTFRGFNRAFSGLNTGLGEGLVPVTLLMTGLIHRDARAEETGVLAGEALADAEILSEAMKNITRRLRPSDIPPSGDFAASWFKAGGGVLFGRGSFPSGHGIGACAVASVIASRYREHRWVGWVAYGLAGVVGFSRVTLQSHFPSDVVSGEVLGCAIGRDLAARHVS